MHCGCPLPGTTIGQRLSRFLASSLPREHDPLPRGAVYSAGTHPSDHNGVVVPGCTKLSAHAAKIARRQKREDAKTTEKQRRRADGHTMAFLMPVPMWWGVGGCAAPAWTVVDDTAGGVYAG